LRPPPKKARRRTSTTTTTTIRDERAPAAGQLLLMTAFWWMLRGIDPMPWPLGTGRRVLVSGDDVAAELGGGEDTIEPWRMVQLPSLSFFCSPLELSRLVQILWESAKNQRNRLLHGCLPLAGKRRKGSDCRRHFQGLALQ
jgi:hypothetical protein